MESDAPAASDQPHNQPTKVASAPFNRAIADTVLVSSDGVEFRVWRGTLREASHFFDTMFDIPQPQGDSPTSQSPPIPVTEDSGTLDLLLRFCYPVENPEMKSLDEIKKVLEAARKYTMDTMLKIVGRTLLEFNKTEPLRVWAIACHFELLNEAQAAAQTLRGKPLEGQYVQELADVTAGVYYRLLQYCAVSGIFLGVPFLIAHPPKGTNSAINAGVQSVNNLEHPVFNLDSMPGADITLRSRDKLTYHVHRDILAIASPVLKHALPASLTSKDKTETSLSIPDGSRLPVFNMAENGHILDPLLRLCYPIVQLNWESCSLEDLKALLAAVLKYQIASATDIVKEVLLARAPEDTVGVYLIFDQHSCIEDALSTAKQILQKPIAGVYSPEMEGVPASSLYRLIIYHQRCGNLASALGDDLSWASRCAGTSSCYNCRFTKTSASSFSMRTWLVTYLSSITPELKLKPSSTVVLDPLLSDKSFAAPGMVCANCTSKAPSMLREFNSLLAKKIDEAINSVQLYGELRADP